MVRYLLTSFSLLFAVSAHAGRTVMEQIPATNYTIHIATKQARVEIGGPYTGSVSSTSLYVSSNAVIGNCVVYSSGGITCNGATLAAGTDFGPSTGAIRSILYTVGDSTTALSLSTVTLSISTETLRVALSLSTSALAQGGAGTYVKFTPLTSSNTASIPGVFYASGTGVNVFAGSIQAADDRFIGKSTNTGVRWESSTNNMLVTSEDGIVVLLDADNDDSSVLDIRKNSASSSGGTSILELGQSSGLQLKVGPLVVTSHVAASALSAATHVSTANFTNGFNAAEKLVQLDISNKLPAVDGSALINLPSTAGGAVLVSSQVWSGRNELYGATTFYGTVEFKNGNGGSAFISTAAIRRSGLVWSNGTSPIQLCKSTVTFTVLVSTLIIHMNTIHQAPSSAGLITGYLLNDGTTSYCPTGHVCTNSFGTSSTPCFSPHSELNQVCSITAIERLAPKLWSVCFYSANNAGSSVGNNFIDAWVEGK